MKVYHRNSLSMRCMQSRRCFGFTRNFLQSGEKDPSVRNNLPQRSDNPLVLTLESNEFTACLAECSSWMQAQNFLDIACHVSSSETGLDDKAILFHILSWSTSCSSLDGLRWIHRHCSTALPTEYFQRMSPEVLIHLSQGPLGREKSSIQAQSRFFLHKYLLDYILALQRKLSERGISPDLHTITSSLTSYIHSSLQVSDSIEKSVIEKRTISGHILRVAIQSLEHAKKQRVLNFMLESSILLRSSRTARQIICCDEEERLFDQTSQTIQKMFETCFEKKHRTFTLITKLDMDFSKSMHIIQVNYALQYAYALCQCSSVHFLHENYETLCAKTILTKIPDLFHGKARFKSLQKVFDVCKLCAISSLPESIDILNHLLTAIRDRCGTSSSEKPSIMLLRMFPGSIRRVRVQKSEENRLKIFAAYLVEDFLLAASSAYISPQDIAGWTNRKKAGTAKDIFRYLPHIRVPAFFQNVDELIKCLSPKVTCLLSEAQRLSGKPVLNLRCVDQTLVVQVGKLLYFTRFIIPPFLQSMCSTQKKDCDVLSIIHETPSVFVVSKSSGASVAPTSRIENPIHPEELAPNSVQSAENGILEQLTHVQRFGMVHRIDNETSGLFILARHEEAYIFYKNIFFQGLAKNLRKHYVAILHMYGELDAKHKNEGYSIDEDRTRAYLSSAWVFAPKLKVSVGISMIQASGPYALVRIELFGGKKHAIRRIFSDPKLRLSADSTFSNENSRRCCILGETLYGPPGLGASPLINRAALHSESMEFTPQESLHSGKGNLQVSGSVPDDMRSAWFKICSLHHTIAAAF